MGKGFIDFKPTTSQEIESQFKATTGVTASIDTTLNSINTAVFSKTALRASGSDADKYKYLKYAIEHETGNYLVVENLSDASILYLFSKVGEELSKVMIPNGIPEHEGVKNKYLFLNERSEFVWKTMSGDYYSGLAIEIDDDHNINLLYDDKLLALDEQGRLTINADFIATKEDLRLKQDKLTAINGLELNDETNTIKTLFNISDQKIEF